jgi:hypothetical protein
VKLTIHGADLRIHHLGISGPYVAAAWRPRVRAFVVSDVPAMADFQATKPPYVSASERCP